MAKKDKKAFLDYVNKGDKKQRKPDEHDKAVAKIKDRHSKTKRVKMGSIKF